MDRIGPIATADGSIQSSPFLHMAIEPPKIFGKFELHEPRQLRPWEIYFRIKDREGVKAWKSQYTSVQHLLRHLRRYIQAEHEHEKRLSEDPLSVLQAYRVRSRSAGGASTEAGERAYYGFRGRAG